MWKECKIIMLPTAKATWPNCIWLGRISKQLRLDTSYNNSPKSIEPIDDSMLPQHLYIISDEEIKEGDWCINDNHDTLYQSDWKGSTTNWNKVIATTDSSLLIKEGEDIIANASGFNLKHSIYNSLPQIPQQFIEEYISEYNRGNVLEEVEVEYEEYDFDEEWSEVSGAYPIWKERLKLSKDNLISLRRKETKLYTREEVVTLCMKIQHETDEYKKSCHYGPNAKELTEWTNEWIKQNL